MAVRDRFTCHLLRFFSLDFLLHSAASFQAAAPDLGAEAMCRQAEAAA